MNTEAPTHAGFIIKVHDKDLYLICHATQNSERLYIGETWTITKGAIEKGETPLQAAIREMQEETGLNLPPSDSCKLEQFATITVNDKKSVIVFLLEVPEYYMFKTLTCNGGITRGVRIGLKEMDGYMWCSKKTAHELVFPSQKELFEDFKEPNY